MLGTLILLLAAPVDDLNASLAQLARTEAVPLLAKPIELKLPDFDGTLTAVDPEKNLSVEVRDFAFTKDRATLKVDVAGEFDLAGKMMVAGNPLDIKARLKARVTAHGLAVLHLERGGFWVKPAAREVELREIEVLKFEPNLLFGGKGLIAGVIRGIFKSKKDDIEKLLTEKLTPLELPRPAVISGPAPAGDNPLLRRYAQSVILSRLAEHATPQTGLQIVERDPAFSIAGAGWLDRPATQAKVEIHRILLREGVFIVSGRVDVPALGSGMFDIPGAVRAESGFQATLSAGLEGDFQFKDGKLAGCNVYRLQATMRDFRLGAAPVRLIARPVERAVNQVLDAAVDQYRGEIEHFAGGPARERLVHAAYRRALDRDPDPAGQASFVEALADISPREVLSRLMHSAEFEKKYISGKPTQSVVETLYRIGLARKPSSAEVKNAVAWLSERETVYEERRVRRGLLRFETERVATGSRARTYRDLLEVVLRSAEYQSRFGAGLPHEG
jgi:hypothetical protein